MEHFVYIHKNPITLEVFYVGQGTKEKERMTRAFSKRSRSKWWNNYVNKHGLPIVEIVKTGLSKEECDKTEIELIKLYGRKDINEGTLVNLTDGGDGSGKRSLEYCKEQSLRMSGENHPMWGKKHSEEWVRNNSLSHIGYKHSDESKRRMSESRRGSKRSEETKKKMSDSLSGEKNPMYGRVGEKNPSSKLTWDIVNEIRELYSMGNTSYKKLGKLYNVSHYAIECVIKHKTWKIE